MANWAGLAAIGWMLGVFVLIHYLILPRHIVIGSFWVWIFGLLAVQLIPGLSFAIAGLKWGNRAGKVFGSLAVVLLLWFVWYGLFPVLATISALGSK